ncbi:MAG: class I SAM-dependent methyltransferase [Patescibacteria group bacterium]
MKTWSEYYAKDMGIDGYIRNLYGQKDFLTAIIDDKPKRVLEVGAGTGTMSIFLSQLGIEVTTIDNDQIVLTKADEMKRRLAGKNILVEGDAFKLPFPDQSFDIVFHQGLLEHFSNENIQQLLKDHLRVAPVVWLSVPNQFYPHRDVGDERLLSKQVWEGILSPYHIEISRYYSLKLFPKWYLPRVPIQYMAKISSH